MDNNLFNNIGNDIGNDMGNDTGNNSVFENCPDSVCDNVSDNNICEANIYTANDVNETQRTMEQQYYTQQKNIEHQWYPYNAQQASVPVLPPKHKKKKEKNNYLGKVVGVCMAFMMTTIVVNSAIVYVAYDSLKDNFVSKSQYASDAIESTSDTINSIVSQTGTGLTVSQVAEAVMPSVVAITSTSIVQQSTNPFFGYGGSYQVQGAGSGIIVGKNDTELLIVTNNHVIEGATSLSVQFTNDVSIDRAYVKGTSADNDIAVVAIPLESIDDKTIGYIKIATLGDSDKMKVGEGVIAIGNALGYGQSLTVGYISAKDRDITIDKNTLTVIQTDAAINGGNSGGALLNMNGEVIGINVAKSSSSSSSEASVEGMGYAIPISHAKDIIENLSNKETRYPVAEDEKGYMGIKIVTSDSSSSDYYNIPEGAYIREVTKGGPADKAGLASGDVIVAIEGDDISTSEELIDIIGTYKAGETVTITVMMRQGRSYEEKDVQVTLVGYDDIEALS